MKYKLWILIIPALLLSFCPVFAQEGSGVDEDALSAVEQLLQGMMNSGNTAAPASDIPTETPAPPPTAAPLPTQTAEPTVTLILLPTATSTPEAPVFTVYENKKLIVEALPGSMFIQPTGTRGPGSGPNGELTEDELRCGPMPDPSGCSGSCSWFCNSMGKWQCCAG